MSLVNREMGAVGALWALQVPRASMSKPEYQPPFADLYGAPISRSARTNNFRSATAAPGLRLYGKTQSGVAPRLEAEEHVGCGTIVGVTLPDIPAGQSRVGVVSVYNRSAATVTQAGGLNGFPAFSSFVRPTAGATRSELRDPSLRGACGS